MAPSMRITPTEPPQGHRLDLLIVGLPAVRGHPKVSLLLRLSPVHLPSRCYPHHVSLSLPCLGSHTCRVALLSSSYSFSQLSCSYSSLLSRLSSLLPNSVRVSISFSSLKAVCWLCAGSVISFPRH